jgi:putative aldouronate transport system permease protein
MKSIGYWWNKRFWPNRYLFLMFLPGLLYFIIFSYIPMGGIVIAFKDYSPWVGILNSPWVGLRHFQDFFSGPYAWRLIRNTLLLNIYGLIFGFPIPIIFALLLNELASQWYKKTIQTLTYFPYFLSMPIVAGLIIQLLSPSSGIINNIIVNWFGREPIYFLTKPEYFRAIYISANIWRSMGYSAIIYLAALTGIDPTLYEAAVIDGANRWQRVRFVTLPGLTPTITILLILSMGSILSVGIDLILLLYNPTTYETADVIGTFVYRRGIAGIGGAPDLGLGTAVGLFQSAVGLVTILLVNSIARKISETSLW